MAAATQRRPTSKDAKPGAVLLADGVFWDVVGRTGAGLIQLLSDDGESREITVTVMSGRYILVREAPNFARLPELDRRTDRLRRSGIFANLDGAA